MIFRCLLAIAWLDVSLALAAAPEASTLFPAGVQQGQSATVTLGGDSGGWPVNATSGDPRLSVEASKDKGKLLVKAAADCPAGLHFLRVWNADGASPLRPFIVGTLAELEEKEPNNEPAKAQLIEGPSRTVNGRLTPAGDVDCFRLELKAGQTLVANLDAETPLGSPLDAVLQVVDARGNVVEQNNDDHGLDPRCVFTATREGAYIVRVFGFSSTPSTNLGYSGGDNFIYRLTLTTAGYADFAWPLATSPSNKTQVMLRGWNLSADALSSPLDTAKLGEGTHVWGERIAAAVPLLLTTKPAVVEREPNDLDHPQQIELPAIISGCVDRPKDRDVFAFRATKGQRVTARIVSRSWGYPVDATLTVLKADGTELAYNDDAAKERDSELAVNIAVEGEYRIVVDDLFRNGSGRHVYLLLLELPEPDFALKVATTEWVVKPDKPAELTVTVDRQPGLADDIEIEALDLPVGLKAEKVISKPKDASAKSVKLKLTGSGAAAAGSFRIVGRTQGKTSLERVAGGTLAGRIAPWTQLWVTLTASQPAKQ